ncbi:MAG TPA: metalloregulator ArsR/SmtB family transcription factor [Gemmatimonadaceae bacterium]|nr:metalloregulator ArsR/SmtB family transcription factor [Gemmatimonadaceae bacterium]
MATRPSATRPGSRATRAATRAVSGADVFHALADPTRRRLLELLRGGERPVHELAGTFRVTRPAISQHLRVLLRAGLVGETRAGRLRLYRLRGSALREVYDWVRQYEAFWDTRLARLGTVLEREARREGDST